MSRPGKRADMLVHEAEPFNAEPPSAVLGASFVTPTDAFYSRNHGPIPHLDPDRWRLVVDGRVDRPLTLSLTDLQREFAEVSLIATMQCAGNRRAGLIAVRDIPGEDPWRDAATSTARWTGVRLADVLRAAGVDSAGSGSSSGVPGGGVPGGGVPHVAFAAPDLSQLAEPPQSYGGSIPLAKALAPEVLLAWSMNGEPLSAVHGAPLRVLVPGWIGARSVKWLERITVRTDPSENYFQSVAYHLLPADADPEVAEPGEGVSLGPVALNSAILEPADDSTVPAGRLRVSGYAFAGDGRGVARVDVSADGGRSWTQADLGPDHGVWAWRLWQAQVDAAPGRREVVARAWDASAALQPENPADVWNPKGYVNNSWPRAWLRVTG